MKTIELKNEIFHKISTIEDAKTLENLLSYLNAINPNISSNLNEDDLENFEEMRKKYLVGEEKMYSWEEIKHGLKR